MITSIVWKALKKYFVINFMKILISQNIEYLHRLVALKKKEENFNEIKKGEKSN